MVVVVVIVIVSIDSVTDTAFVVIAFTIVIKTTINIIVTIKSRTTIFCANVMACIIQT